MPLVPFKYGQVVKGSNFTNRKNEIALLSDNFITLTSSIVISPRRWGKSSLVRKAAEVAMRKDKRVKVCFLDLYKIRTEEEFYELLANEVIKATTGRVFEIGKNLKKFFSHFIPKVTFSPVKDTEFTIGLNWQEVKKNPDEILNLPEKIAKQQKIKLIVCLDEFQNIGFFKDAISFQKKLRANWQNHDHVGYCMYGSKRHMMLEVFTKQSMPFYQFGSLIFLDKISNKDWTKYIVKQFKSSKKQIDATDAQWIAELMENHPYYVQQLAHLCWLNTEKVCDRKVIAKAHEQLLMQLSLLFQNLTDTLSNKQVNLLFSIISGESELSSSHTIRTYSLGTSATVNRSKNALIEKEILDQFSGNLEFVDPSYKSWLTKHYFKV